MCRNIDSIKGKYFEKNLRKYFYLNYDVILIRFMEIIKILKITSLFEIVRV